MNQNLIDEIRILSRKLNKTTSKPRFILWLITDPAYGLLFNYHKPDLSFTDIRSKIPLYEEWIRNGRSPESINIAWDNAVDKKITIKGLDHALSVGAFGFISRTVANIAPNRKLCLEAILNKLKDLLENDGLFTLEDYEKD